MRIVNKEYSAFEDKFERNWDRWKSREWFSAYRIYVYSSLANLEYLGKPLWGMCINLTNENKRVLVLEVVLPEFVLNEDLIVILVEVEKLGVPELQIPAIAIAGESDQDWPGTVCKLVFFEALQSHHFYEEKKNQSKSRIWPTSQSAAIKKMMKKPFLE